MHACDCAARIPEPFGLNCLLRYDELLRCPDVKLLLLQAMVSAVLKRQEIQK